jgi:hypothetical protein
MSHTPSVVLLVLLLLASVFASAGFLYPNAVAQTPFPLYFGVDVAFGDIDLTKQLIDNVSAYTNFFIVGCSQNYNTTRLTEISDYVYAKGLSFLVFTDDPRYPTNSWLQYANITYGDKFIGIYFYDEAGGKQLDQAKYPAVTQAADYNDAANQYVSIMNWWLGNNSLFSTHRLVNNDDYKFFTSDYALYWWDYQSGYDVVFAEFGERGGNWTYSRQLNVALCRGAATMQNKEWGIMITWSYIEPPYMESGMKLYNDMVLAYQNGAKYIVVFDTNENWTQSVLQPEHFGAMQMFWQYVQENPRTENQVSLRTAAVLPENYAYGFRGPTDRIWGLWSADDLAINVSTHVIGLLETYGGSLDLIYPSPNQEAAGYREIIAWNSSTPASPQLSPFSSALITAVLGGVIVLFALAATAFIVTRRKPAVNKLV